MFSFPFNKFSLQKQLYALQLEVAEEKENPTYQVFK